jgi:hypothetical protein
MTHYIFIGGQERPVRFGMAGLYEYEKRTGRKAIADFAALAQGLENVSISLMVDLVHSGLVCGARAERAAVDFDEYTVADWLTGDNETLERVMAIFADSFPAADGKKKQPSVATKPESAKMPTAS